MVGSKIESVPQGAGYPLLEQEVNRYLELLDRLTDEVGDEKLAVRLLREIAKDLRMEKVDSRKKNKEKATNEPAQEVRGEPRTVKIRELPEQSMDYLIEQAGQQERKPRPDPWAMDDSLPFQWHRRDAYVYTVKPSLYEMVGPYGVAREYRGVV